jgi:hypothetical protein
MSSRVLRGRALGFLSSFSPSLNASRLLHHLTSFAPSSAAQKRCAQRATSREQRAPSKSSRLLSALTSSASQSSASFSSALSAWFSKGFRTSWLGEGIAALQHPLAALLALRNLHFSGFGLAMSSRRHQEHLFSGFLCLLRLSQHTSWRLLPASPGGARAQVVRMGREPGVLVVKRWDSRHDDVDADLVRPQGASR